MELAGALREEGNVLALEEVEGADPRADDDRAAVAHVGRIVPRESGRRDGLEGRAERKLGEAGGALGGLRAQAGDGVEVDDFTGDAAAQGGRVERGPLMCRLPCRGWAT